MSDTHKAYELYRGSFPSTKFLLQYFGENMTVKGNHHRGEIDTELHSELRHLFDGVLRCGPKYILRDILRKEQPSSERIYVFKNGVPADWVDPVLERRGLLIQLSDVAFQMLCREFIQHFKNGAFIELYWYQWRTDEHDSIWIEAKPGTVYKDRSLDELIDW